MQRAVGAQQIQVGSVLEQNHKPTQIFLPGGNIINLQYPAYGLNNNGDVLEVPLNYSCNDLVLLGFNNVIGLTNDQCGLNARIDIIPLCLNESLDIRIYADKVMQAAMECVEVNQPKKLGWQCVMLRYNDISTKETRSLETFTYAISYLLPLPKRKAY